MKFQLDNIESAFRNPLLISLKWWSRWQPSQIFAAWMKTSKRFLVMHSGTMSP